MSKMEQGCVSYAQYRTALDAMMTTSVTHAVMHLDLLYIQMINATSAPTLTAPCARPMTHAPAAPPPHATLSTVATARSVRILTARHVQLTKYVLLV